MSRASRRHRRRRCCRRTSAAAPARWRGSRSRWPRRRRRDPACPRGPCAAVFGSSNGDAVVVHDILEALASADRPVSPTQFHNSVHNAAAGYWTIATGSHQPATCLGCHDHTLAASLLKAVAEVEAEQGAGAALRLRRAAARLRWRPSGRQRARSEWGSCSRLPMTDDRRRRFRCATAIGRPPRKPKNPARKAFAP